MNSIIQDWAAKLGLRHQGVLVSAIRGCDNALREDASKWLVRFYRGCLLKAHVGDVRKAGSFMLWCDDEKEFWNRADLFLKSIDHYPNHWILHFMHAIQIMGHYHPHWEIGQNWLSLYCRIVSKFHLNVETKQELDCRLNADEATFIGRQK